MAKIDNLMLKYKVNKRSADALTKIDPTSNGKYLEWLFKMKFVKREGKFYVSPAFPANYHVEIARILRWMEKNGNNPKFKTEYKDINYFKTPKSFLDTMGPLCVPSKKEIKDQVDRVFESDKFLIVVPKSFEASKLYGMSTTWCTTQKTYYNQYNRNGFLFYIIDKSIDRKFGVPVNSSGNSTNLNTNNLEFFNNEDKGLRWQNLKDIYGQTILNLLGEKMKGYYKEVMLDKVRKRVLNDAVSKLKNIKTSFNRDKVYENDEVNKLMESLMVEISKSL
jgi:hypothetical protein